MTHDDATIAAFVDGELDEMTARRIALAAESDAALAATIARHQALRSRLAAHYAPVLDEVLPDRLTALLKIDEKVDDSLAARRAAKAEVQRLRFAPAHWGAIAASLVLGLAVGNQLLTPASPVAVEGGALVASGRLADALETQLASAQGAGDTRIGMTFRAKDGRWCRTFDSAAVSGIGCRSDGAWRLEQTQPGKAPRDYRQASSASLATAAAVMMAGQAEDAAGEKAARDGGWK